MDKFISRIGFCLWSISNFYNDTISFKLFLSLSWTDIKKIFVYQKIFKYFTLAMVI